MAVVLCVFGRSSRHSKQRDLLNTAIYAAFTTYSWDKNDVFCVKKYRSDS